MPEDQELELVYDDAYGELLNYTIIDEDESRLMFIGKIRHKGNDWLAIHRMYTKGNVLSFGKGVRLCIDGGEADMAVLAMQSIMLEGEILDDA